MTPRHSDAHNNAHSDVLVLGGGIVGLATALAFSHRHPGARVTVLEKEARVARHQTGNNSGVVHAGIYYRPGSLKARLCLEGVRLMSDFCHEHGLAYDRCGKVIVATSEGEVQGLKDLLERARANGVPGVRAIDQSELRELEPHAAGLAALHSPNTAIVDYGRIAVKMAELIARGGGKVCTGARVTAIRRDASQVTVKTTRGDFSADYLINCGGLYSDHLARMDGLEPKVMIVPFRGEYYFLKPERRSLVRGLIYPVADPKLPFLGVHFTKTVGGNVEAGPNAVLGWRREGYSYRHLDVRELGEALRFPGFWKLAGRFWRVGMFEYARSFSKALFVRSLRKLVPEVGYDDLVRAGAGVRAQAIDAQGNLLDDFVLEATDRSLHVLNAPSPAATASLAIGAEITRRLEQLASRG